LLAFSRVGRTTAGFVPVDLTEVVTAASAQLGAVREQCGGEVVTGGLPVISGDPVLLAQLMVNLIGNGLKFRRPGVPPRIEIQSRPVTDDQSAPGWEISVSDNGIGIDPQYADKVFVIFQRLHSRDAYAGTGIGLALAKKIVEFHGGRIWLDTKRGSDDGPRNRETPGATVHIWLPALAEKVQ
ncbi:MAG TPA: ATP-binding protein, partial [Pseudonocardiaceae bacterium]|nr:ATP-binding protein [Pseudonocardiaceae bacterium]